MEDYVEKQKLIKDKREQIDKLKEEISELQEEVKSSIISNEKSKIGKFYAEYSYFDRAGKIKNENDITLYYINDIVDASDNRVLCSCDCLRINKNPMFTKGVSISKTIGQYYLFFNNNNIEEVTKEKAVEIMKDVIKLSKNVVNSFKGLLDVEG